MRFRVTSRKLQIFRFVLIEMFSSCFLNSRVISFLARSDCGPFKFLRSTSSSSLLSPTLFWPYFSLRLFRRKRPISSQTSAPSTELPASTESVSLSVFSVKTENDYDMWNFPIHS